MSCVFGPCREKRVVVCPQVSTPRNSIAFPSAEDAVERHQINHNTADKNNVAVIHYSHETPENHTKSRKVIEVNKKQYHVRNPLGNGSYGSCYLVVDHSQKQFVMKQIEKERFKEDEVKIMKLLNGSPHTINLYEVQLCPDNVILLMEYAEGGDLKNFLPSKKLYERDKFKIFQDLMLATEYLHLKGIVHADIKPENILMISRDGVLLRAVLADFGLSLCTNDKSYPPEMARGSARYRSPELCKPKPYNSYASDIWACGCVLVEIYTGDVPWKKISVRDLIPTIRDAKKSPIPSEASGLFLELCQVTLAIEPTKRSTARDICLKMKDQESAKTSNSFKSDNAERVVNVHELYS